MHAGTHKTGTTAIQRFACMNRNRLLELGWLYPDYGPVRRVDNESHLDFAHALAGEPSPLRSRSIPKVLRTWKNVALEHNSTTLISAEAFWRHVDRSVNGSWIQKREAFLSAAANALSDFSVNAIVVLRSHEDLARSSYKETVRRGLDAGKLTFPNFVRERSMRALRYADNLDAFARCFDDVSVALYSELSHHGSIVEGFCTHVGVPYQSMKSVGRVRPSLTIPETIVKRYMNDVCCCSNDERLNYLYGDECQALIRRWFTFEEDLWAGHEEREKALRRWQRDAENVRDRWFPKYREIFPHGSCGDLVSYALPREIRDGIEAWDKSCMTTRQTRGISQ